MVKSSKLRMSQNSIIHDNFQSDSIFEPREADTGDMSATDREIEQFKQFCSYSVPLQNRAKVSFDVKNINFKKKN